MGLLSILMGVVLTGILADIIIENDFATAAQQPFTFLGATQHLSMPVLVAIAFVMGAIALGLILAGIRSLRHGRRRMLKQRIRSLEDENARLHAQRNLQQIVRVPEAEPTPTPEPAPQSEASSDETASNR